MAIQFPNFLSVPVTPRDYSGISDAVQNYYTGYNMPKDAMIKAVQAKFAEPNAQANLESLKLKNLYQGIVNQFAPQMSAADLKAAQLKNLYQEVVNQFAPETLKSEINSRNAMADYRNMGGGRAGVTAAQQMMLQRQLMQDNPQFTPQQAFEAAGNLVSGQQTLNDGTPFNVSGLTQLSASKAAMQGTTSALATQGVKAAQSEAELNVLEDKAQKGLAPYGDTYNGYSPDQIMDTFKSDDESQKKLGRLVASQALQFEIAQNRIRLAMGQPGVTSTQELMDMSGQRIKTMFPRLSYKARKEAADYMDDALKEGLKARQKVGVLQSGLGGSRVGNKSKNRLVYNPQTGGFE